jgi:hypothetical protein
LTPEQTRIHRDLLELVSAGAAEVYLAACDIRNRDPKPPAATMAVGHFLREVDGAVRAALTPYETAIVDEETDAGHAAKISVIQTVLGVNDDDEHIVRWKRFTKKNDTNHLIRYVHRRGLSGVRPFDAAFEALCADFDNVLGFVLDRLRTNAAKITEKLRAIVAIITPTSADLRTLRNNVPAAPFIFDRLLTKALPPAWIDGLLRDGFFADPPAGATASAAMMAARLAKTDLPRARAIISALPDIDDAFSGNAVIEVLLAGDDVDASIFEKTLRWVKSPSFADSAVHLYPQFSKLLTHLAERANNNKAFQLVEALTELRPPSAQSQSLFRDADALLDSNEYNEVLGAAISHLLATDGVELMQLMTERLERAIGFTFDPPIATRGGLEDLSSSWLPAFEGAGIHLYSIKGVLLKRLAEAVASVAENNPDLIPALALFFHGRAYRAFRRLEAFLLLKAGCSPQALVDALLGDARNYYSIVPLPEFGELLGATFPAASPAMQETVLAMIVGELDRMLIAADEIDLDDLKREEFRVQHYLTLLDGYLPALYASRLVQLNAKLGPLSAPTPPPSDEPSTFGPVLPWTAEEFSGWMPDELARRLATTPCKYGEGGLLRDAIAEDPKRYERALNLFDPLEPSYLRSIVSGFALALTTGKPFDWVAALLFCFRALERRDAREQIGEENRSEWSGVRTETCKLIASGGDERFVQFDRDAYPIILAILDRILTDEQCPDDEPHDLDGQLSRTFVDARANALRALLYTLHRFRADQKDVALDERNGVRVNPEAADLLRRFFAQPDVAIHTEAGEHFDFLCRFDRTFARTVVDLIFPSTNDPDLARRAAWQTFITVAPATFYAHDLLGAQYAFALREWPVDETPRGNPNFSYANAIATHALRLFVHGRFSIDADLAPLYARLGDEAAGSALFRLAEAMTYPGSGINEPELARFHAFWTWRRERFGSSPADHIGELRAYGSIFCAARIPEATALAELEAVLQLSGGAIEPSHRILPCLRDVSDAGLLAALRCLVLLVEGGSAVGNLYYWADDIRAVLLRAGAAGGDADKLAHEIASRLTAKRLFGFDTLF